MSARRKPLHTPGPSEWLGAVPLRARRALHAVAVGAVLFISLWPRACVDAFVPDDVQRQDRWIHVACFAALAALTLWSYGNPRRVGRGRATAWVGCLLFGVLLEWLQGVLPGVHRSGSMRDVLGNALGAALGLLLVPARYWPLRSAKGTDGDEHVG